MPARIASRICVTAAACYSMRLISRPAKYLKKLLINIMQDLHGNYSPPPLKKGD